jgi:hypothetical protein
MLYVSGIWMKPERRFQTAASLGELRNSPREVGPYPTRRSILNNRLLWVKDLTHINRILCDHMFFTSPIHRKFASARRFYIFYCKCIVFYYSIVEIIYVGAYFNLVYKQGPSSLALEITDHTSCLLFKQEFPTGRFLLAREGKSANFSPNVKELAALGALNNLASQLENAVMK